MTVAEAARLLAGLPQTFTFLAQRCPACGGNTYTEDGEFACHTCARPLYPRVDPDGSLQLGVQGPPPLPLACGPRAMRAFPQRQGPRDVPALILNALANAPSYVPSSVLARTLSLQQSSVQDTLARLEEQGLVERAIYNERYHYVGWKCR